MSLGVVIIRNSEFALDGRLKRFANTILSQDGKVTGLGWIRDKIGNTSQILTLSNGTMFTENFLKQTPFGRGLKNGLNIIHFNIWILIKLYKNRSNYKIIHACDLDTVLTAFVISKVFSKKIVFDIVDNYGHTHTMPKFFKRVVDWLEGSMIKNTDAVIVCNEERFKETKYYNPKAIVALHNSPDILGYNLQGSFIKNKSSNFKISYIGTLACEGRLLKEIIDKSKDFPQLELHIAGLGPLGSYIHTIVKDNKNVFFYGHISNQDALVLQNESDLLFATYDPSIQINRLAAPLKLYEAMALKKPIIVCKNTTSDIIVEKNKIGLVINYNADEFWRAAIFLSTNRFQCLEFGENGYKCYTKEYSWELMAQKLIALYKYL